MSLQSENNINIPVPCPIEKQAELFSTALVPLPLWSAPVITGILLLVSTLLFIRARILQKELRIIRHTRNAGGIS